MAVRQNAAPVQYNMTRRPDNTSTLISVKAGVVNVIAQAPLFRGDSASGRINMMLNLAEMPKPVNNAIIARAQAWFVPRPALPHFSGLDEYTHAYHGTSITAFDSADCSSPDFYQVYATNAEVTTSEIMTTLGLQVESGVFINTDLFDAYALVQNFRLAAHSSKMTRYNYYGEGGTGVQRVLTLKPAFWPCGRMHTMVADYESALVTGALDLDVSAGQIPVSGIGLKVGGTDPELATDTSFKETSGSSVTYTGYYDSHNIFTTSNVGFKADNTLKPEIFAEMAGETIATTLADIDKARTTNAFAKMMASYAGTNFSGFNNDDVIVSELMQGFQVPQELFNRPWLLDNKTVVFGQTERHATDAANLDDSVTTGQANISLSINIPRAEYGGHMIATLEIMPERLYERQSDEYLYVASADDLPNALRDIQRVEPVDIATLRRWDVAHTTPAGIAAYEPMNAKWKREFTRLGGEFLQTTPGTPNASARTAIWQPDIVDPIMNNDFWLCPTPFPQDVFSVPANDCCEVALMQQLTIIGITQFGDELVEDNSEFLTVKAEQ